MLVKANVEVVGFKGFREGLALVDAGASLTLFDRGVAKKVGVKLTGRKARLVVADGHEVVGELAILEKLTVEGEELPGAHVAVIGFPKKLRERLKAIGVAEWLILGLSTLEILGLTPNAAALVLQAIRTLF